MTRHQEKDLTDLQFRIDRLRISATERVAAMSALRNSFIIIEAVTWLAHKVSQLGALVSPSPALRAYYRRGWSGRERPTGV